MNRDPLPAEAKPAGKLSRPWWRRWMLAAGVTVGMCAAVYVHYAAAVTVVVWVQEHDGNAMVGMVWLGGVACGLVWLGGKLEAVTRGDLLASKDDTIAAQTARSPSSPSSPRARRHGCRKREREPPARRRERRATPPGRQ